MDKVTVNIEADVNPTESEEKVKKAVWNMFGEVQTQLKPAHKGSVLTAQVRGLESLRTLQNALRRDKIRDSSRKPLRHGLQGRVITFYLNKQAAYAGHASFSEAEGESPLGPLKVIVESDTPLELIDWLAPRTGATRE